MTTKNDIGARILLVAAGVAGVSGVMAAATASHAAETRNLAAVAAICLSHAPALLALGLLSEGKLLRSSGLILAAGTLVFSLDLGVREWLGHGLFPGAAPLGGAALMLGWVAIAVAGALGGRQTR